LAGTLSINGSHIHICVSDNSDNTFGGHLCEGCIVFTTAEIIIIDTGEFEFLRENDAKSGYSELRVLQQDERRK
jgi:predicted DNA-binding protein with PD1-like motif